MDEKPQPQPGWYADPQALCWLVAMMLVMLTPAALLFGVALWRVALVLLFEAAGLAFVGWLRTDRR